VIFYKSKRIGTRRSDEEHIVLRKSEWQDDGYYTTFIPILHYSISSGKNYVRLPDIKILFQDEKDTFEHLPEHFEELSDDFISLAADISFYSDIEKLGIADLILSSLNEASNNIALAKEKANLKGVKASLTRYTEAHSRWKNIILTNAEISYSFTYEVNLFTESQTHNAKFIFEADDVVGNRLHAIIGQNGTGKTRFLSSLANDLSGKDQLYRGNFLPDRPPFKTVLAISLSTFDDFYKPEGGTERDYHYIGFVEKRKTPSGKSYVERIKNRASISRETYASYQEIKEFGRDDLFKKALDHIFPGSRSDKVLEFLEANATKALRDNLSSGQKALLYILTQMIHKIAPNSIILIDEIENHLHPSAISAVLRSINQIIDQYNSYCVITTHSPIVLQGIPSKCITVFDVSSEIIICRSPENQTFGELFDTIAEDIYRVTSEKSNYKQQILNAVDRHGVKKVKEYFKPRLPFHVIEVIDPE